MFNKYLVLVFSIFVICEAVEAEEAVVFESASGQTTAAFAGEFFVPENRGEPDSRKIPIRYIRFPSISKKPGAPIVYLSGGPGGSGIQTAKYRRFSLFMEMTKHADVIALDQRGTGKSNDISQCQSNVVVPLNEAITDEAYFALQKTALGQCLRKWKKQGVDVYGYTTVESARDLEDLRVHLGAKKISLWGISYGSHLALAAMKYIGNSIDKVMIATVEGLDQTIKMPARTDAYFDRLQEAINSDSKLKEQLPDIKSLVRSVHSKLDSQPLRLNVRSGEDEVEVLLVKRDLQQMLAATISDPDGALRMLRLYLAIEQDYTAPLAEVMQKFGDVTAPISFRAMPVAMDLASGQSKARYAEIMSQAKTSLLGSFLNSSIHLTGAIPGLDLGEDFRSAPVSDVPTLVLRGSLDGRIYPLSQLEATSGLTNRQVVDVINAGHNLFMTSPEVAQIMNEFMRGEALTKTTINVDLPWSEVSE